MKVTDAYRHLYRGLLRAVQYSAPAKHTIRLQMRRGFRKQGNTLDPEAVKRTVWFLEAAAKERGLEHAILRNMLLVAYWREAFMQSGGRKWKNVLKIGQATAKSQIGKYGVTSHEAFQHFDMTVVMMNKTMGMCLQFTAFYE